MVTKIALSIKLTVRRPWRRALLKLVPKKGFLLRIHDSMMLEDEYPYRVDLYKRQLQCRHWSHHSFQPYIAFGLPNGVCFTCKDDDNNSRVPWMRKLRFYSIFAGIGSAERGRGVPGVVMSSWFSPRVLFPGSFVYFLQCFTLVK